MVSIVPSRFAGLRIEDDDDEFVKPKQKQKNTSNQKNTPGTKPKQAGNHQQQQNNQKKTKPKKPKKQNVEAVQTEQWDKWQEKDSELIDNHFEKDLEQALLMSKLDFEENKTKYQKAELETKQTGKAKKIRPLSLQQFQNKVDKDTLEKETQRQRKEEEIEYNRKFTFFEQIDRETKQIILKEQFKTLVASRGYVTEQSTEEESKTDTPPLEKSELELLKAENVALKTELETLRAKYKKIYSVLKSGEMKDKTELLIEIEKLKKSRDDMTTELTALYAQLEQEKSKSSSAGHDKSKEKASGRKSVRFDASSEIHNGKGE